MSSAQVKIDVANGKVKLVSPYHPNLPAKAKLIAGKWDGDAWVFDARDEQQVRDLAKAIYGDDGHGTEVVDVRYTFSSSDQEHWRFGRMIAKRPGRDDAVEFGDGVIFIDGALPQSGGSRQYPSLNVKNILVEVRDVPVSKARPAVEKDPDSIKVIGDQPPQNPLVQFSDAVLLAELARRGYYGPVERREVTQA